MAGLDKENAVDLIATDKDGKVLLVIVEDRPWGAEDRQPLQLRAKLNSYASYAVDRAFEKLYPETSGRSVVIQLHCAERPTGEIMDILTHARGQFAKLDIGFEVRVRRDLRRPE